MGPLGKIKQKYRSKSTTASPAPVKSKSDENISGATSSRLKRRSSERHKPRKSKVAFEDQQGHSWWNYPLRLMKNATTNSSSSSSSTNTKQKRRQRHYTDPESRKICRHQWRLINASDHFALTRPYLLVISGGRGGGSEPEMRKRTSSLSTPHRAVDVSVDPAHSAILFRDARGVSSFTLKSEK